MKSLFVLSALLVAFSVSASAAGDCDFSAYPEQATPVARAKFAALQWVALNQEMRASSRELAQREARWNANNPAAPSEAKFDFHFSLNLSWLAQQREQREKYPAGACFNRRLVEGTLEGMEIAGFPGEDLAVVYLKDKRVDALFFALPSSSYLYELQSRKLFVRNVQAGRWDLVTSGDHRYLQRKISEASRIFKLN